MLVLVKIMLCADQATIHYLSQWWPSSPTHICSTRPEWFNPWPTEAWWRTLLSVNYVIIVSGDDLSPARHQVIARTNAELLWIGELQCCQLCHRWLHQRLPSWQPQMPPVTTKLASWQLSSFDGSLTSYIAITWITQTISGLVEYDSAKINV